MQNAFAASVVETNTYSLPSATIFQPVKSTVLDVVFSSSINSPSRSAPSDWGEIRERNGFLCVIADAPEVGASILLPHLCHANGNSKIEMVGICIRAIFHRARLSPSSGKVHCREDSHLPRAETHLINDMTAGPKGNHVAGIIEIAFRFGNNQPTFATDYSV